MQFSFETLPLEVVTVIYSIQVIAPPWKKFTHGLIINKLISHCRGGVFLANFLLWLGPGVDGLGCNSSVANEEWARVLVPK